jgi:ABC-type sugar transport system ATPase subunit
VLDAGGGDRIAGVRPEHIELDSAGGERVSFDARVEVAEYLGDEQIAHLLVRDTPVVAKLPVEHRVEPGDERTFSVARRRIHLFDSESEERVN